jgi:hypothetical protein
VVIKKMFRVFQHLKRFPDKIWKKFHAIKHTTHTALMLLTIPEAVISVLVVQGYRQQYGTCSCTKKIITVHTWAGQYRDRIPVGARFSAHVQTGPGAHPASYTMGNGSLFPGVKRSGRGINHPPHLAPRLKKE